MRSRKKVPTVALRGLVVLPGRVEHFDVSRRKSMAALEDAMLHNQKVLLVTQKNPDDLDPGAEALFEYGTLCEIRQLARLPKDNGRVMVEGMDPVTLPMGHSALVPATVPSIQFMGTARLLTAMVPVNGD